MLFGSEFLLKDCAKSIKKYSTHANAIMRANVSLIYILQYFRKGLLTRLKINKLELGLYLHQVEASRGP